MTDLIVRVEHVLRHSQRYYRRSCAYCDRALNDDAVCDHRRELLRQARARRRTLLQQTRTTDHSAGPWSQVALVGVGLAWPEGSAVSPHLFDLPLVA